MRYSKSHDRHVTVQYVRLSSTSLPRFIASKSLQIPDNTIVYKLTSRNEIEILTSHAESEEKKSHTATET